MIKRLLSSFGGRSAPPTLPLEDRPQPKTAKPQPVDVTDENFDATVLQSEQLAVVDFWADWCAPCDTMSAHVAFLAEDFEGRLLVTALDVDENPQTTENYAVMGLPTLLFLNQGVEVHRQVGLLPYEKLKQMVEDLLGNSAESELAG